MGMILGGEYFGDEAAVRHGLWNLYNLRSMLGRRGLVSEFTSNTYLGSTILNLTEIALHARNEEARRIAGECVERLWADILGHFHAPTGFMGGPCSRSYQLDSTGHLSVLNSLLWCTFGEGVIPDPSVEMAAEKIRLVHHHSEQASSLGLLAWMSSVEANPPAYLVEWLNTRGFPFTVRASAERGDGGVYAGTGEVDTTHYQEEEFAVGSQIGDSWAQLQEDTWYLQYRRRAPAKGPEDVRTCYVRGFINDDAPSDAHTLPARNMIHVLQDGRVALGIARPSLKLVGKEFTALKTTFILPTHFDPVENVEIVDGHVFFRTARSASPCAD